MTTLALGVPDCEPRRDTTRRMRIIRDMSQTIAFDLLDQIQSIDDFTEDDLKDFPEIELE